MISVLHAGVLGIKRKAHYLKVTEQMNTFLSQGDQDSTVRERRGLLNLDQFLFKGIAYFLHNMQKYSNFVYKV